MAEQPDFAVIVGVLNDVSRRQAILATQFARMPNVPAFDSGALLLAELQAFRTEVQAFRTDVRGQLEDLRADMANLRAETRQARQAA